MFASRRRAALGLKEVNKSGGSLSIEILFPPGLSRARMVEINRRKCLPDPLTFLTDSTILGRLGCSVEPPDDGPHLKRPPIREGVPEAKEQAVVHAEKIACRGYHFYR
jgi:hypothetical protein